MAEIEPCELGFGFSRSASRRDRVGIGVRVRSGQRATTDEPKQPNILVIMGDDVGWLNIGAYHRGMMSGKTPNLDKLASKA